MRFLPGLAVVGAVLLNAMLYANRAEAQTPHRVTRTPAELLATYVREWQTPGGQRRTGLDLSHVLTHHADYPPADVEALLQGLEQLALTGEPPRLRAEAVLRLSITGSRSSSRPLPGTFARLERIYSSPNTPLVRGVAVGAMGELAEQTDRQRALGFLEQVAASQDPWLAGKALAALVVMDDEGRVVLKRLHETGAVRDSEARMGLAALAKNGYRLPGGTHTPAKAKP